MTKVAILVVQLKSFDILNLPIHQWIANLDWIF